MSCFIFFFLKIISLLPLKIIYVFSDISYLIIYYIIPYRKKLSYINLKNSFPQKSSEELKKIQRKFYRHFCDLIFESIKYLSISKKEILKRYTYKNFENFAKTITQKKDISITSGHYGNWEWGGSLNLQFEHILLPIYKPQRSSVINNFLLKSRAKFGAAPIPKNSIIRELITYRKLKKNIVAVFIIDQKPKLRTNAYETIFLNQQTLMFTGVEKIASRFEHAVYFMKIMKKKRGFYEVEPVKICDNAQNTTKFEITKKHTQLLENLIKQEPAYWLWTHNRWKKALK